MECTRCESVDDVSLECQGHQRPIHPESIPAYPLSMYSLVNFLGLGPRSRGCAEEVADGGRSCLAGSLLSRLRVSSLHGSGARVS